MRICGTPGYWRQRSASPASFAVFDDPEHEIVPGRARRVTLQELNSRFYPEAA